jgi:hypothetical protein
MDIDDDKKAGAQGKDERISALRESIRRLFPAEPYTGKVTRYDGEWAPEDDNKALLDDDQVLYEALNGRRWTEVPTQLLRNQPDGLPLLTDEAYVAFLPAWLMCSLENIHGQNEVRNFVVYNFAPRPEMMPDMTEFTVDRLRVLNPEQRLAIRSLLAEFAKQEASSNIRNLASQAVALIDGLGGQ